MLSDLSPEVQVYIVTGYTNMHKWTDDLYMIIDSKFRHDTYSKPLYLFCDRKSDTMKALVRNSDGFILLYKSLDNGRYR